VLYAAGIRTKWAVMFGFTQTDSRLSQSPTMRGREDSRQLQLGTHSQRLSLRAAAALVAVGVLVAACGVSGATSAGARRSPSSDPSATPLASSTPARTPSRASLNGVTVDVSSLIPGTPYTIRAPGGGDFFDMARQLNIKVIRIGDSRWITTGAEYTAAQWQHVYARAAANGIKIIQLMQSQAQERLLLQTYGLATSPALWMVDLQNEPTINDPTVLSALKAQAAYTHRVAPGIPVTIGGWKVAIRGRRNAIFQRPSDLSRIIGIVDVVSAHLYGLTQLLRNGGNPEQRTISYLDNIRKYANGKPVFLEEWGANNGLAPPRGAGEVQGSVETQATIYRGVLQAVDAMRSDGVLGSTSWIFSPRSPRDRAGSQKGWSIVLHNGAQVLPAATAFLNA